MPATPNFSRTPQLSKRLQEKRETSVKAKAEAAALEQREAKRLTEETAASILSIISRSRTHSSDSSIDTSPIKKVTFKTTMDNNEASKEKTSPSTKSPSKKSPSKLKPVRRERKFISTGTPIVSVRSSLKYGRFKPAATPEISLEVPKHLAGWIAKSAEETKRELMAREAKMREKQPATLTTPATISGTSLAERSRITTESRASNSEKQPASALGGGAFFESKKRPLETPELPPRKKAPKPSSKEIFDAPFKAHDDFISEHISKIPRTEQLPAASSLSLSIQFDPPLLSPTESFSSDGSTPDTNTMAVDSPKECTPASNCASTESWGIFVRRKFPDDTSLESATDASLESATDASLESADDDASLESAMPQEMVLSP